MTDSLSEGSNAAGDNARHEMVFNDAQLLNGNTDEDERFIDERKIPEGPGLLHPPPFLDFSNAPVRDGKAVRSENAEQPNHADTPAPLYPTPSLW